MKITRHLIRENRSGGHATWFHPKISHTADGRLLLLAQGITGGDYYLPVHESLSADRGEHWSEFTPVPGFGRRELDNDIAEGVCDVVPEYHAPSRTVLALGHNVYYRNGRLFDTLGDWRAEDQPCRLPRYSLYSVRDADGNWTTTRRRLEVPGLEDASASVCGCSQRVFAGEDELYLPFAFGFWGRRDRLAATARCRYDGHTVTVLEVGKALELPVGRGLMEPQLTLFRGRFHLTLRTEDGFGYCAQSEDGLNWNAMTPWTFDDGEHLTMTNTQQHFLRRDGKLYLIYNRKLPGNAHLMRYRAPLLVAEVDPDRLVLRRATEQVLFPVAPEDAGREFKAALFGNFHPFELSERESLISVGEERPHDHYYGNTLIARLTDD